MKIAYFDCPSGISGDMCLGALVDAGAPLDGIVRGLKKLPLKNFKLSSKKVRRSGVSATKVDINISGELPGRWKEASAIIKTSALSSAIKETTLKILKSIYQAESKVHGTTVEKVHLHELSDSIVDITGTLIAIEHLDIEEIYSSPLNLGSGEVETAHGVLPVPAPATALLFRGLPVYSDGTPYELTTPTGAAIIRELASGFCPLPVMNVEKTGLGAGSRDIKGKPNILRVFIGEAPNSLNESVVIIETNIDDMDPRIYEYVMERLFGAGALDVYLTQIIMKKGRPAVKLTVLCKEEDRVKLTDIILSETTTIGVRFWDAGRTVLERKIRKTDTPFGRISVKEARLPDGSYRSSAEYDDCKRIARKTKVPLLDVIKAAQKKAR